MSKTKKIRCGELMSSVIKDDLFTTTFDVTPKFYKTLSSEPTYADDREIPSWVKPKDHKKAYVKKLNAYWFGPSFALETFTKIGQALNDSSQFGLIDITSKPQVEFKKIIHNPKWDKIYKSTNWDNPMMLPGVRVEISNKILFVGMSFGGAFGIDIYAHKNRAGQIDSMIFDNDYYFPRKGIVATKRKLFK